MGETQKTYWSSATIGETTLLGNPPYQERKGKKWVKFVDYIKENMTGVAPIDIPSDATDWGRAFVNQDSVCWYQ